MATELNSERQNLKNQIESCRALLLWAHPEAVWEMIPTDELVKGVKPNGQDAEAAS